MKTKCDCRKCLNNAEFTVMITSENGDKKKINLCSFHFTELCNKKIK